MFHPHLANSALFTAAACCKPTEGGRRSKVTITVSAVMLHLPCRATGFEIMQVCLSSVGHVYTLDPALVIEFWLPHIPGTCMQNCPVRAVLCTGQYDNQHI